MYFWRIETYFSMTTSELLNNKMGAAKHIKMETCLNPPISRFLVSLEPFQKGKSFAKAKVQIWDHVSFSLIVRSHKTLLAIDSLYRKKIKLPDFNYTLQTFVLHRLHLFAFEFSRTVQNWSFWEIRASHCFLFVFIEPADKLKEVKLLKF